MSIKLLQQNLVSFSVGLIFAIGLAVSGMTQPQKVIGFLNPWNWDPSLLLVMVGAVGIHMLSYPLIRRKASPLLDSHWHVPTRKDIQPRLILGAAIFGSGWGLAGFCPGPALTSLSTGDFRAILFVAMMVLGILLFLVFDRFFGSRA